MKSPVLPTLLSLWIVALLSTQVYAQNEPWEWKDRRTPAVGFDLDEAMVYKVTSLESEGAGTLRDALWKKGPRLIVFEVGGVIDLGKKGLNISESQVVIAGQTAPSPGITLIRGGIRLSASHVVLQHIAVRPGDAGDPKHSGWGPDGISTYGGPTDVWIDHCSVTWAIDENISPTSYKPENGIPGHRIHVRNCIIAEALNDATHEKGKHSKGSLVFGETKQVAFVRNLFCSNYERNPLFQPSTSGVIVNNVISNPGGRSMHSGSKFDDETTRPVLSVVGNIALFGQNTKKTSALFEGEADAYFKGNTAFFYSGLPAPVLRKSFETLPEPPLWPEGLQTLGEAHTLWYLARYVGARPGERDPIDARIVREALSGTSKIIDSQNDVGGYPDYEPTRRALIVPDEDRPGWLNDYSKAIGVPDTRMSLKQD